MLNNIWWTLRIFIQKSDLDLFQLTDWTFNSWLSKSKFSQVSRQLLWDRVMVVSPLSQLARLSSPFRLCNCQLDGVYGCGCHPEEEEEEDGRPSVTLVLKDWLEFGIISPPSVLSSPCLLPLPPAQKRAVRSAVVVSLLQVVVAEWREREGPKKKNPAKSWFLHLSKFSLWS